MVRNSLKRPIGAVLIACTLGLASSAGAQSRTPRGSDSLVGWLAQAVERCLTGLWAGQVAKSGNLEPRPANEQGSVPVPTGGESEQGPGLDPSGMP